jgi:hypothetical protein
MSAARMTASLGVNGLPEAINTLALCYSIDKVNHQSQAPQIRRGSNHRWMTNQWQVSLIF